MLKLARKLTRNFAEQQNRQSLESGEYIDGLVKNKSSSLKLSKEKQESSRLFQKLIDAKVNRNKGSEDSFFDNIDSEFEAFQKKFDLNIDLPNNLQERTIGRPQETFKFNDNPSRQDEYELKFSLKLKERLDTKNKLNDLQDQFLLDHDITKKLENKLQKKVSISEQTQTEAARNPIAYYEKLERKKMNEKLHHDKKLVQEFHHGEEGTDFINPPDDKQSFNYQMAEHYWEALQETLKERDPNLYYQLKKNGTFPHIHPKEQIKEYSKIPPYPGSPKGPDPNDDPEFFQTWSWENMPPPQRETLEQVSENTSRSETTSGKDSGKYGFTDIAVEEDIPVQSVIFIQPKIY